MSGQGHDSGAESRSGPLAGGASRPGRRPGQVPSLASEMDPSTGEANRIGSRAVGMGWRDQASTFSSGEDSSDEQIGVCAGNQPPEHWVRPNRLHCPGGLRSMAAPTCASPLRVSEHESADPQPPVARWRSGPYPRVRRRVLLHRRAPSSAGSYLGSTSGYPLPLTASASRFFAAVTCRSMTKPQPLAAIDALGKGQLGFHRPTARARLGAGEEPLGNHQPTAAPDGLVAELVPYGPEGLVGQASGQSPVADHPGQVEVLDHQRLVSSRQVVALCKASRRELAIRAWSRARRLALLLRLAEPVFLREWAREARRRRCSSAAWARGTGSPCLGATAVIRAEIARSMPTAVRVFHRGGRA